MGEILILEQMFVLPLNFQLDFDLICLGLYPAGIGQTKITDELVGDEKSRNFYFVEFGTPKTKD